MRFRSFAVLLTLGSMATLSGSAGAQSRIPDENWPKYRPPARGQSLRGFQRREPKGGMEGVRVLIEDEYAELRFVSTRPEKAGIGGYSPEDLEEVIEAGDSSFVGDAQVLHDAAGNPYVFFRWGYETSDLQGLYVATRDGSGWEVERISDEGLFDTEPPDMHTRTTISDFGASLDADGNPVCYWFHHDFVMSGYGSPPSGSETSNWELYKWTPAGGRVGIATAEYPYFGMTWAPRVSTHRGHLLSCGQYSVSGGTTPVSRIIHRGATGDVALTITEDGPCEISPASLFIASDGTPYCTWRKLEGGVFQMYSRVDTGTTASWGAGHDAVHFEDANGVRHRYLLTTVPANSNKKLTHSTYQTGAWTAEATVFELPDGSSELARILTVIEEGQDLQSVGVGSGFQAMHSTLFVPWENRLGTPDPLLTAALNPYASANLSNGNLSLSVPLFAVAGHGPTPAVSFSYNSMDGEAGYAGQGWRHNYCIRLRTKGDPEDPDGFTVDMPDGSKTEFARDGATDDYFPGSAYRASLAIHKVPGTSPPEWILENRQGLTWRFNARGFAKTLADRDGNSLSLTYSDNGLAPGDELVLATVTDAYSRTVTFSYDELNRITGIIDPSGSKYFFYYDEEENVLTGIEFCNSSGTPLQEWSFGYYTDAGVKNMMRWFRTPWLSSQEGENKDYQIEYYETGEFYGWVYRGLDPEMAYGEYPADRKAFTIEYSATPVVEEGIVQGFVTTYTNRQGLEYSILSDYARGLAKEVTDPVNENPTVRVYNDSGKLLSETDPGGKTTDFSYVDEEDGLAAWVKSIKNVTLPGDTEATEMEYHETLNTVTQTTSVMGRETNSTYDSEGHLTEILYPGETEPVTNEYDAPGKLTKTTNQLGNSTTYVYASGSYGLPYRVYVDGVLDASGNPAFTEFTYNVMGQIETQTSPFGGTTTFEYDALHRLIRTILPDEPGYADLETEYFPGGLVEKQIDANGNETEFEYDLLGRLVLTRNAADDEATNTYSPNDWLLASTDFAGRETTFEYDDLGRLTSTTKLVDSTNEIYLTSSMTYDDSGNIVTETVVGTDDNPPARTTTYVYDSRNLLTKKILPDDSIEVRFTYNPDREIWSEETWWKKPGETEHEFYRGVAFIRDDRGRVEKQIALSASAPAFPSEPSGRVTELSYDAAGNLISTLTPLLHETLSYYDEANRLTRTVDPTGVETRTSYNADSLVVGTSIKVPGHPGFQTPTTNEYDTRGRLYRYSSNVWPANYFEHAYDAGGRLTAVSGPDYFSKSTEYDVLNRVVAEVVVHTGTDVVRNEFQFDAVGNLTARYASPGASTGPGWTYTYDEGNRQTSAAAPISGHVSTSEYDALGNVVRTLDEDSNETLYSYDDLNRLVEVHYKKTGGATWEIITRTYDAVGNVLSVEGSESEIRIEYQYHPSSGTDPHLNELRKVTWKLGGTTWKSLEYDYDDDSRRVETRVKDSSGTLTHRQEFAYDDANRITSISNEMVSLSLDPTTEATFDYEHGFLVKTTLGNGNEIEKTYDKKGRLASIRHSNDSGATLALLDYAYDMRDRRTEVYYAHLDLRSTFNYWDNSWLKEEHHHGSADGSTWSNPEADAYGANPSTPSGSIAATPTEGGADVDLDIAYTYDLRGNRLTRDEAASSEDDASYEYDLEDRLTSETRGGVEIEYAWSDRGELIEKTVDGTDVTSYDTDFLGRITHLTSTTEEWTYTYAPTGQRILKQNVLTSSDNLWSLPDGDDTLIDAHKVSGTEVFDGLYVNPSLDGRVARIDGSGEAQYYVPDGLGSVHQVVAAAGTVSGTNFTDAWGRKLSIGLTEPSSGAANRWGFTGRENDDESGLMHYRARAYDPELGRFLSRDPVVHANLYFYCDNDPSNSVDPTGRDAISDIVGMVASSWGACAQAEDSASAVVAAAGDKVEEVTASIVWTLESTRQQAAGVVRWEAELARSGARNVPSGMISGQLAGAAEHLDGVADALSNPPAETLKRLLVPDSVERTTRKIFGQVDAAMELREQGYSSVDCLLIVNGAALGEECGLGDMYDSVDKYSKGEISAWESYATWSRGSEQLFSTAAAFVPLAGKGGGKPVHSAYADGTPVFKGERPPRLPGPTPDPQASGAHTRLRFDRANNRIYQGREFSDAGNPVQDIDFTSPTRPDGTFRADHVAPGHTHAWRQNIPGNSRSGWARVEGGVLLEAEK